jgi:hypothetical protein
MEFVVLCVVVVVLFVFAFSFREHLGNVTKYDGLMVANDEIKPGKQRYLTFLGDLLDTYNKKMLETPVCNRRMLEKVRKDSLRTAYNASGVESCRKFAADVCEFTDPKMYIADNPRADNPRAVPRWLSKTLLSMDPPTNTNLNCYNTNYNCCKQLKQIAT